MRPSARSLCASETVMERRITLDGTNTMKYDRSSPGEETEGGEAARLARTTVPSRKQTLERDCSNDYAWRATLARSATSTVLSAED